MKKVLVVVLLIAIGCVVTTNGQLSYKQYSPNNWPYIYDANMVVGKILGGVELPYGQTWDCEIVYDDPDGDPITVSTSGVVGLQLIGGGKFWRWQWTPTESDVGMHYLQTTIIDVPLVDDPQNPWDDPLSEKATIFVLVRKLNGSPVLAFLKDILK